RFVRVRGLEGRHVLGGVCERVPDERADVGLVVDDEDLHGIATGRRATKVDPPPGVSSYSSVPPCKVRSDRAIARPRPEPAVPSAVRTGQDSSKLQLRYVGGIL